MGTTPTLENRSAGASGTNKRVRGVLLVNLGSPDSTEVADVRRYLNQFLMDERVIDLPYPLRKLIVGLFILPFRPKNSAHAYRSIWWEEGSPLIVISRRLQAEVQKRLQDPVALGMRYGNPSIEAGLKELLNRTGGQLEEVFLVPLYPQYAMSTYETVVVETERVLKKMKLPIRLQVLPPFYNHPDYVSVLVESAREYLSEPYDFLLFSFHGLPERHLRKTDPTGQHCLKVANCCQTPSPAHERCYRHQALVTTRRFVEAAGIPEGKWGVAFQSRLGKDTWLTPFTDQEIARLAGEGVKRLRVICPGFVADCLETLEEIGIRGKETFFAAGGEDFQLIPCLNTHPRWVELLSAWCHSGSLATKVDQTRASERN
ncbi:MAG: ferrochelatase [Calditrichaeota bacterium]|nr:MAG: ferrochelatase [Calditrichota bacterium]